MLFATVVLCGVAASCFFGFLTTYDPHEAASALRSRLVYGTVGGLAVLGLVLCVRGHRRLVRRGR